MFCPSCKCEFRPSFTRCASCDVDLVDDLAAAEPKTETAAVAKPVLQVPMAEICGFLDLAEARRARDLLHEHRIPAELVIRAAPETPVDGAVIEEYWLRGDAHQIRQIQALLAEPEPEPEPQAETFKCSNCDRPVRKEESFCANCGLRFSE